MSAELDEARLHLKEFLLRAERVLKFAVALRPLLLPKKLHADVAKAWREMPETFHGVHAELRQIEQPALASVGLVGIQLQVKMNAFDYAYTHLEQQANGMGLGDLFKKATADVPDDPFPWSFGALGRGLKKLILLLKNNLAHVNAVLGSLKKVIPKVELIEEFKDCVENSIETHDIINS